MENEKKQDKSILDRVQSAFTGSEKTETVETPVIKKPIAKTETITKERTAIVTGKKDEWSIKPRTYLLKGNKRPLSKMIRSAGIYFFDEEKGYEREIKYCENQQTCFVEK